MEIGFDSPEAAAQIQAAFEQMQQAFAALAEAARQAWQALVEALRPLVDIVVRVWSDILQRHWAPRQYRDTMQRRKLRRYFQARL